MFDREGRFKATPLDWTVDTKPSGVVQLAMRFAVFAILHEGEWADFQTEEMGYFNLILKDGSMAEKNVENLVAALDWHGGSLASLQDGDWSQKVVQLTVKYKPASTGGDGKEYPAKFEIVYINPEDFDGVELKKLEPAAIKALDAKFGAKFRAFASKNAPAKTAAPRTAPARAATPANDPDLNAVEEPGAIDEEAEAVQAEAQAAPKPAPRTAPPRRAPARPVGGH